MAEDILNLKDSALTMMESMEKNQNLQQYKTFQKDDFSAAVEGPEVRCSILVNRKAKQIIEKQSQKGPEVKQNQRENSKIEKKEVKAKNKGGMSC